MGYPHLLPALTVTGLEQRWGAASTDIRVPRQFCYLAILLQAYRRRCIGWALKRHLEAELARAALPMALATRTMRPGLVHHSDLGVQCASQAFTN
jgi:transposase InsO family protein